MAYKKRTSSDGKPLWMPIWVAERVADTSHLPAFELGFLHRLELSYWRSGPPRDCDETLARICGCTPVEFRRARPSLETFFSVEGGQWVSQKLDSELAESYRVINAKRNQTAAATKARMNKRSELRNDVRNVERNDVREINVTGNQLQVNSKPPLAKAVNGLVSLDDAEVLAAVSDVEKRCGVIGHV